MGFEPPAVPRTSYSNSHQGIKISVAPRPKLFHAGFMLIWIALFVQPGLTMYQKYFDPSWVGAGASFTDFIWIFIWAWFTIYAVWSVFWNLFGRESLLVGMERFTISKSIFGLPVKKSTYEIAQVFDLRSTTTDRRDGEGGITTFHSLAFAYGAKTVHAFVGLDVAEQKQIMSYLARNCPQLKRALLPISPSPHP